MEKTFIIEELEKKYAPLWWHLQGLTYTASGYGSKIPTDHKVRLPGDSRWRRVYHTIWSNIGTSWVQYKGERIVIR